VGQNLFELIGDAESHLKSEFAQECGLQVASALEFVHSKNVFHEDVKPSNMLVSSEGQIGSC
jgi:serine/threonine protein kinase